jgi:hypothetical protein
MTRPMLEGFSSSRRPAPAVALRPRRAAARTAACLLPILLLGATAGCSTRGSILLIPINYKKLSTTESLVDSFTPTRSYYWVDDEQRLCIAMSDFKGSAFGEMFEKEFALSLVLDELPAGSARTYRANRQTMRLRARDGFSNFRSASLSGLVTVWDFRKKTLHGRFRLTVTKQTYSVLTGWANPAPAIAVGEFTATHNPNAGHPILTRTEQGPMKRPPKPVVRIHRNPPTQPADTDPQHP